MIERANDRRRPLKRVVAGFIVCGTIVVAALSLLGNPIGWADEADAKNHSEPAPAKTPAVDLLLRMIDEQPDLKILLLDRNGAAKQDLAAKADKHPRVDFLPPPSPGEQEILTALNEHQQLEFVEQPLSDVVAALRDAFNIEILLDDKALDDAAMSGDKPITLPKMKKTSLKSILFKLRKRHGLYYLIEDDALTLTTKEVAEAEENLILRVYPVGDLLEQGDFDSLMNLITETVSNDSWEKGGGVGEGKMEPSRAAQCLAISQTQDEHDKVLRLLNALRAAHEMAGPPLPPAKEKPAPKAKPVPGGMF